METGFDIIEKRNGDVVIIKIEGELDALVAPKLKDKITKEMENGSKYFVIDFENLVHINSLAMGILRGKLKLVKDMGGDIKLVKLNDHIKEIFEMIGLDEIFEIYESESEAVNSYYKN